jgi:hypothetical protein
MVAEVGRAIGAFYRSRPENTFAFDTATLDTSRRIMSGYLVLYRDDTWRGEMGRYDFYNAPGFSSWTDAQNDKLSSFVYNLPVGWGLRIHEHRDPASRNKLWVGAGHEVRVNKNDLPSYLHDRASGHTWVQLGFATIQQAFDGIQPQGPTDLRLVKPAWLSLPSAGTDGHQQGIQRIPSGGFAVSASARDIGYLYFTDAAGGIVHLHTPSHSNFNHLGGFQVVGNLLAIGYERFENRSGGTSRILFYDIADAQAPVALTHLAIARDAAGQTAGAVGLLFAGDRWLAAVLNWDAARLDIYASNGPNLADPNTRFGATPQWTWSKAANGLGPGSIDHNWEPYQNINLFPQIGQPPQMSALWFVATHTNGSDDWADLYRLDLSGATPVVTKTGKKHFHNSGGGQSFVNAAGFRFDPTVSAFEVYAAEAHIGSGGYTRVNRWL